MSNSQSDHDTLPSRPSDHVDSTSRPAKEGTFGWKGWLRWGWRQLTSMRNALILLLLMAIAAIPGSLFPQRSADPNGVVQYYEDNPELAPTIDNLQLFDVYGSAWFSAIYLLLFVSLIGCIIPRIKHHANALRAPAPTPVRLQRMAGYSSHELHLVDGQASQADIEEAMRMAETDLRRRRYRTARYDSDNVWSVSAERGYLRETGNLVFHSALVGILVTVLISMGNSFTGDRVIVQGTTFVNSESAYSSFTPGRFFDGSSLTPYAISLEQFDVDYVDPGLPGAGQAGNFAAHLSIRDPDTDDTRYETVRVNDPIIVNGDWVYLLGNGYAPLITVRNSDGDVVYQEPQPFLPQDDLGMTSLGIVKVTDGLPEQVGLLGFLYPTQGTLETGAYYSVFPDLINPVITFNVFTGDLGIDDGTPRSVYELDTETLTQITGGDTGVDSIELAPGDTADLPNGMGTITFEDLTQTAGEAEPVSRFAFLQIQRDTGAAWVLVFSILATAGLITGLLVPRRRLWVKAILTEQVNGEQKLKIEYAGLTRGEDPGLDRAIEEFRNNHLSSIAEQSPPPFFKKGTP